MPGRLDATMGMRHPFESATSIQSEFGPWFFPRGSGCAGRHRDLALYLSGECCTILRFVSVLYMAAINNARPLSSGDVAEFDAAMLFILLSISACSDRSRFFSLSSKFVFV